MLSKNDNEFLTQARTHHGDDQQAYWDAYFKRLNEAGSDLDWGGRWTEPFIPLMREAGTRDVLELGCGTGNDAARLAAEALNVVAVDLSPEAIQRARAMFEQVPHLEFRVVDVAAGLPFADGSFDAVMSNVALHMFSDSVTRAIFEDVRRILRPSGLFLFHVNAHDDRPLRAVSRKVVEEIEPDYVLEDAGQRVRFFSEAYLRELLADWQMLMLDHVELELEGTRDPFKKRVWRVAARPP